MKSNTLHNVTKGIAFASLCVLVGAGLGVGLSIAMLALMDTAGGLALVLPTAVLGVVCFGISVATKPEPGEDGEEDCPDDYIWRKAEGVPGTAVDHTHGDTLYRDGTHVPIDSNT